MMINDRVAIWSLLALFLGLAECRSDEPALPDEKAKNDFFETKIRPLLIERCYECHSDRTKPGELGGGLRLDFAAGLLRGGSLGAALQPKQPEQSLLVRAIEYGDPSLQMPPDKKLSDEQIADLKRWIAEGAFDPRLESPANPSNDPATQIAKRTASHWAYQPLKEPTAIPLGEGAPFEGLGSNSDPIDSAIARQLAAKGLSFSPEADRRTLIRRLYYDLTGLPPSLADLQHAESNPAPDWYAQLVESLLQSPHFGERMARRWMDVARYADNKGYVFQEDREYPYAHKYRDWLIRSFNEDMPYDQFVSFQLIGDRLDPQNEKGHLDAMGMLTLGRRFLKNPHDIADDRIDVISRGLMGVTAACARCHDHKFDPVSMADYYSLHGAMLGSDEPGGDPSAMRLVDREGQGGTRILIRGNPGNPGPEVPRKFFGFLASYVSVEMKTGSGRLEMAQAIVDPKNPLTSRVYVNRLWGWIFGVPLVDTPSDFGIRCDPPAQQIPLDILAWDFVHQGWSTKQLVRRMVMSRVYRQQSFHRESAYAADPENQLWWRAQRKRMDFESLRDALLAATGELDRAIGGPSVKITDAPFPKRRTVYAYIDRQNLPQLFRTFDFASPDAHVPIRSQTTVPQQGLVLMNSDLLQSMLVKIAKEASMLGPDAGIDQLFERILARKPTAEEKRWVRELVESNDNPLPDLPKNRWSYGIANYQPETGLVGNFRLLPRFHKNRWQGNGDELPDSDLDWAFLSATGGHPGLKPDQAVVRRWTVTEPTDVRVRGMLKHTNEQGNGVRGSIIVRGKEKLGEWTVHNTVATTMVESIQVAPGDTIDFVTDCLGDTNSDTFEWKVRLLSSDESLVRSSSEREFSSAQPVVMTIWEQAAQALLLTNEFCFID